jgi:hypothetical protein
MTHETGATSCSGAILLRLVMGKRNAPTTEGARPNHEYVLLLAWLHPPSFRAASVTDQVGLSGSKKKTCKQTGTTSVPGTRGSRAIAAREKGSDDVMHNPASTADSRED